MNSPATNWMSAVPPHQQPVAPAAAGTPAVPAGSAAATTSTSAVAAVDLAATASEIPTRLPPGPLTSAELATLVPAPLVKKHYRRIWHGMYRRVDQSDDLLIRSRALARTFPDGVLRGRSAALLWGDDSVPADAPPEIWLPTTRKAREGRVYRYGALPGHAITEIGGLRVTTPLRTCRDLAVDLDPEDAVVSLERLCAMVAELPSQLTAAIEHPSGRGAHRFARAVRACDPGSFSALSTRARLLLADADCGDFRHGHRVVLGSGTVELPLADPAARCVVFTTAAGARRDRPAIRHQSLLQSAGWTVIIVRDRAAAEPRVPGSGAGPVSAPSVHQTGALGIDPGTGSDTTPGQWQVAIPRRAAGLLAARWPATELRLPANRSWVDDPHGLWGPA